MSRMADEKCLLEDLQELVGCLYLSDLRLLCSRERVRQALKQLKAEDYAVLYTDMRKANARRPSLGCVLRAFHLQY